MRTHFSATFLIALSILLSMASCKKEKEDTTPVLTKKQKLIGNNWMISSYYYEPAIDFNDDGSTENEVVQYFEDCEIDDIMDLNESDTYNLDEGVSKCDVDDLQVFETGTWSLSADESVLIFEPEDGDTYDYLIHSVSSSQLVLRESYAEDGVDYTVSITFD